MLKIDMEFRKGILFIRLKGQLNKKTVEVFNNEIIPVVLKHGLKNIVINFDKLNSIDLKGIESLIELNDLVSRWNGKTTLCSINEKMKKNIYESKIYDRFYEVSDELTALEVFKIWKKIYYC